MYARERLRNLRILGETRRIHLHETAPRLKSARYGMSGREDESERKREGKIVIFEMQGRREREREREKTHVECRDKGNGAVKALWSSLTIINEHGRAWRAGNRSGARDLTRAYE